MEHPDQLERLAADPSLVPVAVDEILRYGTPLIYFRRTATEDTEIRGVPCRPGIGSRCGTCRPTSTRTCSRTRTRFDVGRRPNPHTRVRARWSRTSASARSWPGWRSGILLEEILARGRSLRAHRAAGPSELELRQRLQVDPRPCGWVRRETAMRAAVLHEFGQPLVVEELPSIRPRPASCASGWRRAGSATPTCTSPRASIPPRCPWCSVTRAPGSWWNRSARAWPASSPGDHVLLTWLPYCGHCRECVRGRPNICENTAWYDATLEDGTCRFRLNGQPVHHYNTSSFAERSVVPARTAIKVDPRRCR